MHPHRACPADSGARAAGGTGISALPSFSSALPLPCIFLSFLCRILIRCLVPGTCQNPCITRKRRPSRPALPSPVSPGIIRFRGTFCVLKFPIIFLCCFCYICCFYFFCPLCCLRFLRLQLLSLSAGNAALSRHLCLLKLFWLYWQNAAGCTKTCGIPTHFICCFVMFLKFFYAINTCFMPCFQTNTCIFIFLLFLKEAL